MEINLVYEGFKFMVVGMTTVFIFLLLLILLLNVQYRVVTKILSIKSKKDSVLSSNKGGDSIDPKKISAIKIAISNYERDKS